PKGTWNRGNPTQDVTVSPRSSTRTRNAVVVSSATTSTRALTVRTTASERSAVNHDAIAATVPTAVPTVATSAHRRGIVVSCNHTMRSSADIDNGSTLDVDRDAV